MYKILKMFKKPIALVAVVAVLALVVSKIINATKFVIRPSGGSTLSISQAKQLGETIISACDRPGTTVQPIYDALAGKSQADYNKIHNVMGKIYWDTTFGIKGGFLFNNKQYTFSEILESELEEDNIIHLKTIAPDITISQAD